MTKGASITKKNDSYIIQTNSRTTVGFWIGTQFILEVKLSDPPELLVEKLLSCLSKSSYDIPHPKDWKDLNTDFLKIVKAKSLKAFYTNTKYCVVNQTDEMIRFLPTKNVGGNGRFDHLPEFEVSASIKNHKEIFEALEKAFDNCI